MEWKLRDRITLRQLFSRHFPLKKKTSIGVSNENKPHTLLNLLLFIAGRERESQFAFGLRNT